MEGSIDIASMPKVELHLHLEGSARPAALRDALRRHTGKELPDPAPWLVPDFRFADFEHFAAHFRTYLSPWLRAPSGYAEMIRDVVDSLLAQRVRYAEINFAPAVVERVGGALVRVLEILRDEAARASESGCVIRWIAGLDRGPGPDDVAWWVRTLASHPIVAGFDLHGAEAGRPVDGYAAAFAPAIEAGKKVKVHAGEMAGPEYIRAAIDALPIRQIGHGVSAIRDPALVAEIRERGIVLEMCPTSNERLRNIASFAEHPILALDDAGIAVTLNSDDSLFFGPDLSAEMRRLVDERGVAAERLVRWTRNALSVALLDAPAQGRIGRELDVWAQGNTIDSPRRRGEHGEQLE